MTASKMAQFIIVSFVMICSANFVYATELALRTKATTTIKSHMMVDIRSGCTVEGAVFKIINRGEKWPQTAMLKLYNYKNSELISERRIRLANRQQLSFIVGDGVNNGQPVAVWLDPKWYDRPFAFDAMGDCRQK